eukprot:TRINITY_DN4129_c0_g1_i1.p1 TRINITY_DN4129_c0_g1~~TRINITY_DN4129_c0_g1_i1.p1  ORF type:complete len:321 (+),score=41.45 TRINITY_DN4129_c0_g1_i1:673-1635(+)
MIVRQLNCTSNPDACESEREFMSTLSALIGSLSLLGSFSIIFSIIWLRLYRRLKNRMILYVALSDFIYSVGMVLSFGWIASPPNGTEPFCVIQSLLYNYGQASAAAWNINMSVFVTIFIFSTAVKGMENLPGKKYEIFSMLIWAIGFLVVGYGATRHTNDNPYFGSSNGGVYCWIGDSHVRDRIEVHYLWVFLTMGVMCILAVVHTVYLCCNKGNFGEEIDNKVGKLVVTLAGYPIIYAVLYLPVGVARLLIASGVEVSVEVLWLCSCLVISNGFLTAIYYGHTRSIYRKWKSEFQGRTLRGKRVTQPEESSSQLSGERS